MTPIIARQNYEKAYFRSNIIASKTSTIIKTNSLTGDCVKFHIIPQKEQLTMIMKLILKFVKTIINLINL